MRLVLQISKNRFRQYKEMFRHYWPLLIVCIVTLLLGANSLPAFFKLAQNNTWVASVTFIALYLFILFRSYPPILLESAAFFYFLNTYELRLTVIVRVAILLLLYFLLVCLVVFFFQLNPVHLHVVSFFCGLVAALLANWSFFNRQYPPYIYCVLAVLMGITTYWIKPALIVFAAASIMLMIYRPPKLCTEKYLAKMYTVDRTHAAAAHRDMAELMAISQAHRLRSTYSISFTGRLLRAPFLGKSFAIDTLRASRAILLFAAALYLTGLAVCFFTPDTSFCRYVYLACTGLALGTVCNEYCDHIRLLKSNIRKGFPLPSNSGHIIFGTLLIPALAETIFLLIGFVFASFSWQATLCAILISVAVSTAGMFFSDKNYSIKKPVDFFCMTGMLIAATIQIL